MDATPDRGRLQFGLRPLLVALAVCPIVLAAVVQLPGLLVLAIIVGGLLALGVHLLTIAERVARGGTARHEWRAGALTVVGVAIIACQIQVGYFLIVFALALWLLT